MRLDLRKPDRVSRPTERILLDRQQVRCVLRDTERVSVAPQRNVDPAQLRHRKSVISSLAQSILEQQPCFFGFAIVVAALTAEDTNRGACRQGRHSVHRRTRFPYRLVQCGFEVSLQHRQVNRILDETGDASAHRVRRQPHPVR
jgi:hypothetical protein